MELEDHIKRSYAIEHGIDAFGKKWGITLKSQTSLYGIGLVDKDTEIVTIPKKHPSKFIAGLFTNTIKARENLDLYLNESWDFAEKEAQKATRKAHKDTVSKADDAPKEAVAAEG